MDLFGFEVEARTPAADDLAAEVGRWFADAFGVVPHLSVAVADLDAAVTELASKGIVATDVEVEAPARAARVTGPAGVSIDVVEPAPPGHDEAQIGEFIASAADLDGPPTDELADDVSAIVAAAWSAIGARLAGVASDKVLATHLLLSSRSRSEPPDGPTYWQTSAASTLLSSFIGRSG